MTAKVTDLQGWAELTKEIRTATGCEHAEPDLDEIYETLACGNEGVEVSACISASGSPELIRIPQDIIDWCKAQDCEELKGDDLDDNTFTCSTCGAIKDKDDDLHDAGDGQDLCGTCFDARTIED